MRPIKKPDIDNTSPQYWERVLESHGLGLEQLGLRKRELTQDEDGMNFEERVEEELDTIPLEDIIE